MKAYECEPNDLVNYEGIRHKVKEIIGDSIVLINTRTMCDTVISKFHSVTMVERPRKEYPKGHEFRVYKVSRKMGGRSLILARGLTYPEAEIFRDAQEPIEGHYFMICNGKKKREQF